MLFVAAPIVKQEKLEKVKGREQHEELEELKSSMDGKQKPESVRA